MHRPLRQANPNAWMIRHDWHVWSKGVTHELIRPRFSAEPTPPNLPPTVVQMSKALWSTPAAVHQHLNALYTKYEIVDDGTSSASRRQRLVDEMLKRRGFGDGAGVREPRNPVPPTDHLGAEAPRRFGLTTDQ